MTLNKVYLCEGIIITLRDIDRDIDRDWGYRLQKDKHLNIHYWIKLVKDLKKTGNLFEIFLSIEFVLE